MSAVSNRIRDLLDEKRMSYAELSRLTQIPKPTLRRYAIGKGGIPVDRLEVIAAALLTTAPALMGWKTDGEEEPDIIDLQLASISRAYREASPEIREAVCRVLGIAYVPANINDGLVYGKNLGGG